MFWCLTKQCPVKLKVQYRSGPLSRSDSISGTSHSLTLASKDRSTDHCWKHRTLLTYLSLFKNTQLGRYEYFCIGCSLKSTNKGTNKAHRSIIIGCFALLLKKCNKFVKLEPWVTRAGKFALSTGKWALLRCGSVLNHSQKLGAK